MGVFDEGETHLPPLRTPIKSEMHPSAARPARSGLPFSPSLPSSPRAFSVPDRPTPPETEEAVLAWWEENDTFRESVRLSEGKPPYSFYDGPPFATGLPHYGHILAGTIKDIVCRYAHQTGHHVERRFGWDCHGLPVEFEIDKALGISGRDDVLKMGIDKYNAECRKIVMRYSKEWEQTVKRVGRWIDFENGAPPYVMPMLLLALSSLPSLILPTYSFPTHHFLPSRLSPQHSFSTLQSLAFLIPLSSIFPSCSSSTISYLSILPSPPCYCPTIR